MTVGFTVLIPARYASSRLPAKQPAGRRTKDRDSPEAIRLSPAIASPSMSNSNRWEEP